MTRPSHSDVQEQATLKTCTAYSLEYVADEDVAQEEYLVGRLRALGLVRAATEN